MSPELVTPARLLRVTAPLVVALVAVAAVLTGMTPPAIGAAPVAVPVAVVPATPRLPAAIEQYADYEGQTLCTPATKSGVQKLVNLIRATYGKDDIGIGRPCSDGGQSEHKEGRAIDWMIDTSSAAAKADAQSFLTWLLATDKAGNPNAMARRLGIMYIGWNNKMWRAYDPGLGWSDLKGCSIPGSVKNKSASYNTYCHRNHIHLSLSWDGAQGATSFWTGKVTQLADCRPSGTVASPAAGTSLNPRLLIDTAKGVGTGSDQPCRLGVDRWSGDGRALRFTVPVPAAPGPYVFRARVERYWSNAPGALLLDTTATTAVAIPAGTKTPYTVYLPINPDGKVSVFLNAGDASVRVVGLGVVKVAPTAPVKAAPAPTTKARPTITQTLPATAKRGTTFTINGKVTLVPAGAVVRRYLKVGTVFQARGAAVAPSKGTWRMPVAAPSRQVGRYIYRIALVSNGRIIAWSPVRAIVVR